MTDQGDLCFICQSPGECSHREPDLRGWRSRQAYDRRQSYLADAGRAAIVPAQQPTRAIAQPPVAPVILPASAEALEEAVALLMPLVFAPEATLMPKPLEQAAGSPRRKGEEWGSKRYLRA
jgi:hypothetical protein